MITNYCNLKCLGCMQSCDRNKNPYYITLEELQQYLSVIKTNTLTVNGTPVSTIHLTGGDPLTHPQFLDICELIKQVLPDFQIDVSTNGLFLQQFSDEDLLHLNSLKVTFQLSLYPNTALLNMYETIKARFNRLNIYFTFGGMGHFYFSKQEITTPYANEHRDYSEQCSNMLSNQNHAILYKGNIYSCWKDVNLLQRESHPNHGALDIFSINSQQELIENKKHYFCDVCKRHNGSGGEEYMFWKHHYKNPELVFSTNFKDLFIYHYDVYYELRHQCPDWKEILSNELFLEHLPKEQQRYAFTRFLNGEADIFIPFSQEIPPFLKEFLHQNPNIKKYNIYLVSINNSPEVEESAYMQYTPYDFGSDFNVYFLKATSMYKAYQTFLQNSYLPTKLILNLDNFTINSIK